MEEFLRKKALTLYWITLFIHCFFQYLHLPYVAVTKPMLVPLLILNIILHDHNIGRPAGKFIFYIGLVMAFFGDVLLIFINDTFFLSGMVAFMLMNLLYSISFLYLNRISLRSLLPISLMMVLLFFTSYAFYGFLGEELGDYGMPVLIYIITLSIMLILAVNVAGNDAYRKAATSYLIPGTLIFLLENILVAANKFHFDRNKDLFVLIMFLYGLAQYLMVKGIAKAYPQYKL